MKKIIYGVLALALALFVYIYTGGKGSSNAPLQDYSSAEAKAQVESGKYPTEVYFGDTHTHTGNSLDVFMFGTTKSTPELAYRYATGEKVKNPTTGEEWQIATPLDFLVVADHAEAMGTFPELYSGNQKLAETKTGKAILELTGKEPTEEGLLRIYNALNYITFGAPSELETLTAKDLYDDLHATGEVRERIWSKYVDTAEKFNKPGKFTTLVGWEWTSNISGANLHRVIFTPAGPEKTKKIITYSYLDSTDPEDLWAYLDRTSEELGIDFVAIPHNSNISLGKMFSFNRLNGKAIDAEYAKKRMKWEKVVEITQIKGTSETHPALASSDEFSNFEIYEFALTPDGTLAKADDSNYVRSALKRGLQIKRDVGVNPFKFGVVGSTDGHTGIPDIAEDNFPGKAQHDSAPEIRNGPTGLGSSKGWDMSAAGYAGVWARENTREEIFAAFKRKEVYATTGPRIKLRFFGGFNYTEADLKDIAKAGYTKGVPMGSDITSKDAQGKKAPTFIVQVVKDPKGANLDRAQIVKGWVDKSGKAHERIYDVAFSGERELNKEGRVKQAVGNTVDLKTGKYTNTIGATELTTVWTDPNFDPSLEAVYYVRALEIPTPRYSLYDAIKLGIDPKATNHPATIQERVYSSPIWYITD